MKKIITLALSVLLAFSLTSCFETDKPSSVNTSGNKIMSPNADGTVTPEVNEPVVTEKKSKKSEKSESKSVKTETAEIQNESEIENTDDKTTSNNNSLLNLIGDYVNIEDEEGTTVQDTYSDIKAELSESFQEISDSFTEAAAEYTESISAFLDSFGFGSDSSDE